MKTLRSVSLLLCMGLLANTAQSQSSEKINLFKSLPEKSPISTEILASAIDLKEGLEMDIRLFGEISFKGRVISNIKKYHNLQSVLIESTSGDKTIFQISRQLNDDKTVNYVGKMLNRSSADGLQIMKDEKGGYYFSKFETSNIIQDCSYNH